MPELTVETKIAAGNNNAAGLALVSSLSASGIPFLEPLSISKQSRGELRVKANGVPDYSGFKSLQWTSGLLWLPQWAYLRANFEGPVTIRCPFEGTTWSNFNGVLTLGNLEDYELVNETQYGWAIKDFRWAFTRVSPL